MNCEIVYNKKYKRTTRICKETYLLQDTNSGESVIGRAKREDCMLGLITSHSLTVLIFVLLVKGKRLGVGWAQREVLHFFPPMISFSVI